MSKNITHTLSNGITLEQSSRKSNRTGYTGAALSVAWTLDASHPFIAACGNPSDPLIKSQLRHQERTSWHGGSYADAREAAYVVALFKQDPVEIDNEIAHHGVYTKFPEELYDLPEGLAFSKAVDILNAKKRQVKVKISVESKDPTVSAAGNLYKFFPRDVIVSIARKFGGPEAFQSSLVGKSITDFSSEHNLVV